MSTDTRGAEALLKLHFDGLLPGRDIAVDMSLPRLFAQVSYRTPASCYRCSDRCVIAVSCPDSLLEYVRKCISLRGFAYRAFSGLHLLLSGDVELNPGPGTDASSAEGSASIEGIYAIVRRLERGQTRFFTELEVVKKEQSALALSLQELQSTVAVLQSDLVSAKEESSENLRKMVEIKTSLEDTNKRSRRNNLIVFGLCDCENESWRDSEKKAIAFFHTELEQTITTEDIERAHRLGKFREGKNRPIIVNFCRFKVKEQLLSCGSRLKDKEYAIREDFSPAIRYARSKLVEYALATNLSFKTTFR
ncbi:uncharacterized protein [Dermacentor albipictus]|uniref:uncharacterized protein n=1 Tax=Dermacentor albipictus TaxID=60249 RepID=UPI0038FD3471